MIEWFRQREFREQLVLAVGAVLALLIVGWTLVWSPLRDGASELDVAVDERLREVVDLRRAAGLRAGPAAGTIDARNLLLLANETAGTRGLSSAITQTRPDGGNALNVTFRDARFDRLIGWLIGLESDYGVTVAAATFRPAGGAGLVSGTVRIERS